MKRLATILPLLLLSAAAERSPLDRLPRDAAGSLVRRAIAYAGGWPTWAAKKTVQFQLTTRRFKPDGSVAETFVETHQYRLAPTFGARIGRGQGFDEILMINNGMFATKVARAAEDFSPAAGLEARDATFGGAYVFGMPFKLADPGTHFESLGRTTPEDGSPVDRIRVTYDKGVGDAGGLHAWVYSFDVKTGRLAASFWDSGSGKREVTEYFEDRTFGGIRIATRRVGYEADSSGRKGRREEESVYGNVQFDVALEDSLFAIPPK